MLAPILFFENKSLKVNSLLSWVCSQNSVRLFVMATIVYVVKMKLWRKIQVIVEVPFQKHVAFVVLAPTVLALKTNLWRYNLSFFKCVSKTQSEAYLHKSNRVILSKWKMEYEFMIYFKYLSKSMLRFKSWLQSFKRWYKISLWM